MDGTLLADDASICQRNINTIKEAISKVFILFLALAVALNLSIRSRKP